MSRPTITAVLDDGPLKGVRVQVEPLEGRPPKTIDLDGRDGGDSCRYCLDGLVQSGDIAIYSFVYRV